MPQSRNIAGLTSSQRDRKRANDRDAQRRLRARTKEHIEDLERQIQELLQKNRNLETELSRVTESTRQSSGHSYHGYGNDISGSEHHYRNISADFDLPDHSNIGQAVTNGASPGTSLASTTVSYCPNIHCSPSLPPHTLNEPLPSTRWSSPVPQADQREGMGEDGYADIRSANLQPGVYASAAAVPLPSSFGMPMHPSTPPAVFNDLYGFRW